MKTMKTLSIIFASSFLASTALAVNLPGPLVETDWLAKNMKKVTILDVRKDVKSFTTKPVFKKDKNNPPTSKIKMSESTFFFSENAFLNLGPRISGQYEM